MDAVSTNRGKMYLSGQHCAFGWDTMTVAEQMIAEKLGMDVIEVATRNLHGPEAQNDYSPVPSFDACVAAGKKLMNWQPHPAGAKKLPDGRMHGLAFRYQMCPRHAVSDYSATVYLRGGKVYHAHARPLHRDVRHRCRRHGGGGRDGRQVGRRGYSSMT